MMANLLTGRLTVDQSVFLTAVCLVLAGAIACGYAIRTAPNDENAD